MEREEDERIYVPDQSFLDYEESFWIEHVNYDDDYSGMPEQVESLFFRSTGRRRGGGYQSCGTRIFRRDRAISSAPRRWPSARQCPPNL